VIYLLVAAFTIYRSGVKWFWWTMWVFFGALQIHTQFDTAVHRREIHHPILVLPLNWQALTIHFVLAVLVAATCRYMAQRRQLSRWPDYWRQASVLEAF
jgi:hypothetical protein